MAIILPYESRRGRHWSLHQTHLQLWGRRILADLRQEVERRLLEAPFNGRVIALLDLIWGDSGKGKLGQYLAELCDLVVGFNGAANSGKKVYLADGRAFTFHQVPVGVSLGKLAHLARGKAVDLFELGRELQAMAAHDMDPRLVSVALEAHVTTPLARVWDIARNHRRAAAAVGKHTSTARGVASTYGPKYMRFGAVRVEDVYYNASELRARLREQLELFAPALALLERDDEFRTEVQEILGPFGISLERLMDPEYVAQQLVAGRDQVRDLGTTIFSSPPFLWSQLDQGRRVMLEGSNGTQLGPDSSVSWPDVTSSNGGRAGFQSGTGIGVSPIVTIGVAKPYLTSVGAKVFLTRMDPEVEAWFQKHGGEFGSTTGLPRMCGWWDGVVGEWSWREERPDILVLNKFDVLLEWEKPIYACVDYQHESGWRTRSDPTMAADVPRGERAKLFQPVYRQLPSLYGGKVDPSDREVQEVVQGLLQAAHMPLYLPVILGTGPKAEDFVRFQ